MTLILFPSQDAQIAAANQAKVALAPSSVGVYGVDSDDNPSLVGSGTILELCGEKYLLTSQHVLDVGYATYPRLARRSGSGLVELGAYWERSTGGRDIAVTRIEPDGNVSPVGADALAASSASVGGCHLFLQGYPEKKSHASTLLSSIESVTQPYITYESETPTTYDAAVHFEVDWDPTVSHPDENGRDAVLPSARGVSGSAVWSLGAEGSACRIETGARIVGVAHQFHEERRTLIVVRIEEIRKFLLQAIRRRAAYLDWCGRGRAPSGSDADWAQATQRIPALW